MIYIVDPAKLHDEWGQVKPDVLRCLEMSYEPVLPEDVYCAIRTGQAALVVSRAEDDEYLGMSVLTEYPAVYDPSIKTCHIWLTRTHSSQATLDGIAFIKDFAKSRGCSVLTLRGTRKGFFSDTWVKRMGLEFSNIELRAEL